MQPPLRWVVLFLFSVPLPLNDSLYRLKARKASVKLVYELSAEEVEDDGGNYLPEGTILEFCRNISSAGVGSYRLDGREVTYEVYESMLQKIGSLFYSECT